MGSRWKCKNQESSQPKNDADQIDAKPEKRRSSTDDVGVRHVTSRKSPVHKMKRCVATRYNKEGDADTSPSLSCYSNLPPAGYPRLSAAARTDRRFPTSFHFAPARVNVAVFVVSSLLVTVQVVVSPTLVKAAPPVTL